LIDGGLCRTWDDFLVLAAQRWTTLSDEIASGRIADYLGQIHRPDLMPRGDKNRSPDDQLDDWLARLPSSRSSAPELDVHPGSLIVRAAGGGGVTRQMLKVSNVGYRLLRCTARIEPPGASWLRLGAEQAVHSFATIDHTDLPVDVEIPEALGQPIVAAILLESNGGTRRIEVRIERPVELLEVPEPSSLATPVTTQIPEWGTNLVRALARLSLRRRILIGLIMALFLRLLVILLGLLPIGERGASIVEPRLSCLAVVLSVAGAIAGGRLARQQHEWIDWLAAGFTGGVVGLMAASAGYALVQSVELILGPWSSSIWAVEALWGAIGSALALASYLLVPDRGGKPEIAP
jgi:hypothetical protein